MAVTTTPRDIIVSAYAKSMKNKPGTIATESTELLQLVIRALRGLYSVAARVNPTFFAESADVTLGSSVWARPETSESIYRIERVSGTTGGTGNAGDEVVVVPFDDKKAEEGLNAVYEFGQKFYSAGNSLDPTGGDLKFYYSKRPTDPATLDTALDALWQESYDELLILETAIYLAMKDTRAEEVKDLKGERDVWASLFIAFLEHCTANERRRFGHIHTIVTKRLIPLNALFAGGANLPG